MRRWDSTEGISKVRIPTENGTEGYLPLEDGIEIKFGSEGTYLTGDYWLIPARTIKGAIEWPRIEDEPEPLLPKGIEHHYCRLAIIDYSDGTIKTITDCRKLFRPLVDLTKWTPEEPVFAPIAHTGLIDLEFTHSQLVTFKNFEHFYKDLGCPPVVILGLVGSEVWYYWRRSRGCKSF